MRLTDVLKSGATWTVESVEERQSTRKPYAPFTTSTLQQEANRKLSMTARRTMQTAQRLYEDGHITYMRTDSVNLSGEAISAARETVKKAVRGQVFISLPPQVHRQVEGRPGGPRGDPPRRHEDEDGEGAGPLGVGGQTYTT